MAGDHSHCVASQDFLRRNEEARKPDGLTIGSILRVLIHLKR